MIFTDEQFESLKIAEPFFDSARKGYVKYATREISNKVADIYFEATGQKIPKSWGCSICVLNLYRRVGIDYFKDKEEREKIKASLEPENNEAEDDGDKIPEKPVANKNKKKDGRRKI